MPLQGGLGSSDRGLLPGKLLHVQGRTLFSQLPLLGGLRGEKVAGCRQRFVFGPDPQPKLRAQQGRDHLGLQASCVFGLRLGDQRGGFAHLGVGARADEAVHKAGQVEGHDRIGAGAFLVAGRGCEETARFAGKTSLRFRQLVFSGSVRIFSEDGLQTQGRLGLCRGVQFARHDVRGLRESELENHQAKLAR